jgi:hypothetical protein
MAFVIWSTHQSVKGGKYVEAENNGIGVGFYLFCPRFDGGR